MVVSLLLLIGVAYSIRHSSLIDPRAVQLATVVTLALLIPALRRWAALGLDTIRAPSWRPANWTAVGIAIVAALLLYAFAAGEGRPFVPTWHDEHAYLIQMQMLARGRLWMPQHPIADFFETFHVIVKPVYAPVYFPGTALLYVPAVWLHLPYWLMPLLTAGAVVGMTYRVLTELVDGVAGLLGAVILLSLRTFRLVSIMVLSHPLMMLWALLSIWLWLLWRRRQGHRWGLLLAIVLGWAAITRPLDALCFAMPVGIGVLWELRGKPASHKLGTLGLMLAGIIPFLTLQFAQNYRVTAYLLETPHHYYSARELPGMVLGFEPFDPKRKPQSGLLQTQQYYRSFIAAKIERHTQDSVVRHVYARLAETLFVNLPDPLLFMLIPAGLLGLTDFRHRVVWSGLVMFLAAYACFPAFLPHYALLAALPVLLTLVAAISAIAATWPSKERAIASLLTLGVAACAISAIPGIKPDVFDQDSTWPVMTAVHKLLPLAVHAPAIVLFPFHPGDSPHEEPVYNIDVAWPDDAPIVHVQDLGTERNQEVAAYYATTQPDRNFYVFDRRDGSVHPLGKPAEFLAKLRGKSAARSAAYRPNRLETAQ